MASVQSPLSERARTTTGEMLQEAVVDLVDLTLQAKQAHWNLTGRSFRSLHLHLDEVVSAARTYTDNCAERAVAIGVNPDGRVATVAEHAHAPRLDAGYLQDDKVLAVFVDILAATAERFRERIRAVSETDPVTENILEEITHDLEKHHWMFQAQK